MAPSRFYNSFLQGFLSRHCSVIPPSHATETAQAGSPTTGSMKLPPPVIVPETMQSFISNEDIVSLPSIISLPAPTRPPTQSVVSDTVISTSSWVFYLQPDDLFSQFPYFLCSSSQDGICERRTFHTFSFSGE